MLKPPLSVRLDPERLERFYVFTEGVPEGLLRSLLGWTDGYYSEGFPHRYINHDRVSQLERVLNTRLPQHRDEFMDLLAREEVLLLDAVDHALSAGRDYGRAMDLKAMLDEARSVYTVDRDGNGTLELQLRQPAELTAVVDAAAGGTSNASLHLREAWSRAFARVPDPAAACIEVTKAVEVAAKPVATPNDPRATLGKMIAAMNAKPTKWTTDTEANADVESVIALMELVWTGCPRHGDNTQPATVTPRCAQMLVQAGAILVHWFLAGGIRAA